MRLNELQRTEVNRLIAMAFLDISQLASTGKPKQAAELATAFHKLAAGVWRGNVNLKLFRDRELALFFSKHRQAKIWKRAAKYFDLVNEVLKDADPDYSRN